MARVVDARAEDLPGAERREQCRSLDDLRPLRGARQAVGAVAEQLVHVGVTRVDDPVVSPDTDADAISSPEGDEPHRYAASSIQCRSPSTTSV